MTPPTMDILNPPKFVPHGMDHYQHLKVQCLNTSDEAIELSLKGNVKPNKKEEVEEGKSGENQGLMVASGLGSIGKITEWIAGSAYNKQAANWLYAETFYGTVETGWTSANPILKNISKVGYYANTSASVLTTGYGYYKIAKGDAQTLDYIDTEVGTVGLGIDFASYYYGLEIPLVGEFVAIYGTARLGWDFGCMMGKKYGPLHGYYWHPELYRKY